MRTSRRWLSAIIPLILAAGPSTGVVAQEPDAGGPPPATVTATRDCVGVGDALVAVDADGTEHLRDLVSRCTLTSDAASLADPYILITHTDCYPGGDCTVWGTIEPEGANGWQGPYRGWVDADGTSYVISALEGAGVFEGQTFVARGMGDLGLGSTADVLGVIYVGAPPPWDEVPPR